MRLLAERMDEKMGLCAAEKIVLAIVWPAEGMVQCNHSRMHCIQCSYHFINNRHTTHTHTLTTHSQANNGTIT